MARLASADPPAAELERSSAVVPAGPRGEAGVHLLLLGSVVVWASTFIAMKVLLRHVTPFELVGLRFAIGLPVLAGVLAWKRIPLAFDRADLRPLAIGSAVLLVHFLVQPIALSLEKTTATNTGWIISFSPLWLALLSWLLLGERIGGRQIAGIAAATAGVLLLVSGGDLGGLAWIESAGDWLIFLSSLTWALYTVATRDLSRRRGSLAVTLVVFLPLCLSCLAVMLFRSDLSRFAELPLDACAWLLGLGVLGTLAQWSWQTGVARIGASRAGLYVYLQPLVTTAIAVPVLGERLGSATALGGILVLGGVWWAQRRGASGARMAAGSADARREVS